MVSVMHYGARTEEDMSEDRAGYVIPLDTWPQSADSVRDLSDTAPPLAVGAPLPEPSVPLADQPAFAELMRLEAQLIRALQEERDAAEAHYESKRVVEDVTRRHVENEEAMVCTRTRASQAAEALSAHRLQMVTQSVWVDELAAMADAGGGA